MAINLNVSPYFDDYSQDKDYLRVLFRPGFAVQARELTQLQSILQSQIKRFADSSFKDGERIKSAEVQLKTDVYTMSLVSGSGDPDFPLINSQVGSIEGNIGNFKGRIITNADGTVRAKVLDETIKNTTDTNTTGRLYFTYLSNTQFTDSDKGFVYAQADNDPDSAVTYVNVFDSVTEATLGLVQSGIYYIDGFFSRITPQNIVLSNTTHKPTGQVGFTITSKTVDANDDATLFDNARGSTNEGAPGADRLQNALDVVFKSATDQGSDPNFYKLISVVDGVIQGITIPSPRLPTSPETGFGPVYASVADQLARRTREESGSYTVTAFVPKILDSLDDSERFEVSLSPGLAYVNGARIETLFDTHVSIPRQTDTTRITNYKVGVTGTPYLEVTNVNNGVLPGLADSDANGPGDYANRLVLLDSDRNAIGYARSYAFQDKGSNTGNLYLHDIKMFKHIKIKYTDNTTDYVSGVPSYVEGQEIKTNSAKGYIVKLGSASQRGPGNTHPADSDWTTRTEQSGSGLVDTLNKKKGILVVNASGNFGRGQTIVNDLNITAPGSRTPTVDSEYQFNLEQVHFIEGMTAGSNNTPFQARRKSGSTAKNVQSALIYDTGKEISGMREDIQPFDNDFSLMYKNPPTVTSSTGGLSITPQTSDTQWSTEFGRNGAYKKTFIDDATEITKTLKFAAMKIRNVTSDFDRSSNPINFSWVASDRQINLFYPDVYKVYGIAKGTNNNEFGTSTTTPNASFPKIELNISGGGTIVQGSRIIGKSSGTEAIVALSNTLTEGESLLSNVSGYHVTKTGTGDATKVEVIFTKGSAFTASEILKVVVPAGETAFNASVSYIGLDTKKAGQDISANYNLDSGQRPDYYGISAINRRDDVAAPDQGDLFIFFSYFEADPFESYFYNADSYSGAGFFDVDPRYFDDTQSIVNTEPLDGQNLRNAIDFRFRQRLTAGSGDVTKNPLAFPGRTLDNTGYRVLPDSTFTSDIDFFNGQKVTIVCTDTGLFKTISSASSLEPKDPIIFADGMPICDLEVPPAVRYAEKEVFIETKNHRRYSMKDIAELDQRLETVENGLALSLLESQALHENVDDRLKAGFVVDDFADPIGVADIDNRQYAASNDIGEGQMRPPVVETFFDVQRVSDGTNVDSYYIDKGPGYVLKSYTQEKMLEQLFASSTIRVNPYATWTFNGDISINPDQDFWRDPSSRVVAGYQLDRTSFGGGVTAVSEDVFRNLRSVTSVVPGSRFNTTSTNWTGTRRTTRTRAVSRQERNRLRASGVPQTSIGLRLRTTTTVRAGTRTTRTFERTAREFSTSTRFQTREVRELDDAFMRSIQMNFIVDGMRKDTPLKALFDGIDVTKFCQQTSYESTGTATYGAVNSLTTDSQGRIRGRFTIPANTFKTGARRFQLTDLDDANTTNATATFTSRGFFEVGDMIALRSQEPQGTRLVGEATRRVTQTSVRRQLYDPVAQGFTLPLDAGADPNAFDPNTDIPRDSGSFITSVDVYFGFVDVRDQMNRVTMQIRDMINGYPGPQVLGTVTNTVSKSNQNLDKPTVATNFRFDAPCYLKSNTEYAIVILSPSDTTTVWTAVQGEQDINTGGKIDRQPNVGGYYGSFFKSQNNSTWTPDQNRDLMFKAYRAKFGTAESSITLRETSNMYAVPIGQAASGLAIETFENSYYIKVHHPNHGMYGPNDTHQVRIIGVEPNGVFGSSPDSEERFTDADTLNGVPLSLINNTTLENLASTNADLTHKVKYATQNSYFIDLSEADSDASIVVTSPQTGGWHKTAKAGRGGGYGAIATSNIQYDAIRSNVNPTIFDGTSVTQKIKATTGSNIDIKVASNLYGYDLNSIYYQAPGVKSPNFVEIPTDELIELTYPSIVRNTINKTGTGDFEAQFTLNTENEYLSPVMRLDAAGNYFVLKNAAGNFVDDSEIDGLTTTSLAGTATSSTHEEYISYQAGLENQRETSQYITKEISLEVPASEIRVFFDADMEPGSSLEVRYKARRSGDNTPFEDLAWQRFPRSQQLNETNFDPFSSESAKLQYELSQDIGFDFDSFKVALVLNVKNESLVPKVSDLRIIAVA